MCVRACVRACVHALLRIAPRTLGHVMQILNYELRDQPLQVILNTHFSKNVYLLNIDIFVFSPRLSIAIKQESINV